MLELAKLRDRIEIIGDVRGQVIKIYCTLIKQILLKNVLHI